MSNLEHLIENGLCILDEGRSYREWRELMQQDCNWQDNENITLDNLWEICQYVFFTWDSNRKNDFFDWLACAVMEDSWEEFPGAYREIICRKLVRLGVLKLEEDVYVLPDPKRT